MQIISGCNCCQVGRVVVVVVVKRVVIVVMVVPPGPL